MDDDAAGRQERDALREERRREREREQRMAAKRTRGAEGALAGVAGGVGLAKRSKLSRDTDRDVSERVALGQANVGSAAAGGQFDTRLFSGEGGLGHGLMRDDADTFDDPLFADRAKANLFAPTGAGRRREAQALGTAAGADTRTADQAVTFEKEQKDEDLFGLDAFLNDVRKPGARNG